MKTRNSIKNSFASMSQYIILMIIGFVAQKIFLNILGLEYLGLNGLFTNIVSMLGIVELGLGSAIIYSLYKPIVDKDYKSINALMNFYKKAYHIIALVIFLIGIVLIPFIPYFISDMTIKVNITLAFIMFLIDIVASYLSSYKRSILYADQKNYIVNVIHIVSVVVLNVIQLLLLYLTKNYYLFLLMKIIFRIIENVIITIFVNHKYKHIFNGENEALDKKTYNDIIKKIKALFFHKIAGFVVNGTDNIVISKFIGIIYVGLYSNYYLIINSVNTLFNEVFNSLTPSIGHLLVENNKEKDYEVFKKIRFVNFIVACFSSITLLLITESFITIWLGKKYLLSNIVLIILVINFYEKMMRNTYLSFKNAAGIFYEDRFIPILESVTNIVVSIVLAILIGLPGVFIGTIVSGLWLWCYSYPKYVYTKLFNRKAGNYYIETITYLILFVLIITGIKLLACLITFDNMYIEFFKNTVISFTLPIIIFVILFRKNENFKYFKSLIFSFLNKKHTKK